MTAEGAQALLILFIFCVLAGLAGWYFFKGAHAAFFYLMWARLIALRTRIAMRYELLAFDISRWLK